MMFLVTCRTVSIFVYLDDILFFSPVKETHVQHVKQVLQRLLHNQLYVKAEMWGSFVFSHVLGIYCGWERGERFPAEENLLEGSC